MRAHGTWMTALLVLAACELGPGPAPQACDDTKLVRAPLRRLTTAQYTNSLRDLFRDANGDTLAVLSTAADHGVSRAAAVWLPPEQLVAGYAGNAQAQAPSAVLIERYNENAITIANELSERRDEFLPCELDADHGCGLAYLEDLAYRAWRRPLTQTELERMAAVYDDAVAQHGPGVALAFGVQHILQSPHFLYLVELAAPAPTTATGCEWAPLSDFELATRLALLLWNTTPDAALLERAAAGQLRTPASIEAVAKEMIEDPRHLDGALAFHEQWLHLDRLQRFRREVPGGLLLDQDLYGDLMREQAQRFLAPIVSEPGRRFDELLSSRRYPMHGGLLAIHGVAVPGLVPPVEGEALDDVWIDVELPASERAGAFTLPGLLSAHATYAQPSPVRRGVLVLDRLLCATPPPPPANVELAGPDPDGDPEPQTNRARYAEHTNDPSCRSCHEPIDSLGFAFERYDAAGSHRSQEAWMGGGPEPVWLDVDASVTLAGAGLPPELGGQTVDGAIELLELLAESPTVARCYVSSLYAHALGRWAGSGTAELATADEATVDALVETFDQSGGQLDALMLAIVTSEAFTQRATRDGDAP